jgi:hypothetical protein
MANKKAVVKKSKPAKKTPAKKPAAATKQKPAKKKVVVTNRELVTANKARLDSMEYLNKVPKSIPAGKILAHNPVRHTRNIAMRGFRIWLAPTDTTHYVVCECGFAPELGDHYMAKEAYESFKQTAGYAQAVRQKKG